MNNSDLSVVCRVCQRKVKMDMIKFDEVRVAYVCESCYRQSHESKEKENSEVGKAEKEINGLKDNLIKYTCGKCKYHFARQKDKEIKTCPYCGSESLEILDSTANKIISDSEKYF